MALVVLGTQELLLGVRDFYVTGKGTLAPWAPPANLVRVGLYQRMRNPMYVAVGTVLFDWAATFGSWALCGYAVVVLLTFHLRVVLDEEPFLTQRYGAQWEDFRQQVPRWFIRMR